MTEKEKKEKREDELSVYIFLGGYIVFMIILLILNSCNL